MKKDNKEAVKEILVNGQFELDFSGLKEAFNEISKTRGWSERAAKGQMTRCSNFEKTVADVKDNGREMNGINTMIKEARKFMTCGGEPCREVDFVSCFATILTGLTEGAERKSWEALLRAGFYERIAAKLNMSREAAKKEVNCFIGGMHWTKFESKILEVHFPQLRKKIRSMRATHGKNSLVLYCTKTEGKIVLGAIKKLGVPARSLHDGVFCRECDKELVKVMLISEGTKVLGFEPMVEFK